MVIVANLLLGLASLLTCLVVFLVADARHAAGADAMGLVVVPMLLAPRWLAIAGAAAIAGSRLAFGWLHPSRAGQITIALLWLILVGAASFGSVMLAFGPDSRAFKPWAFALAVLVPACTIAAVAIAINGSKGSPVAWRVGAGVLTAVVAVGGAVMLRNEWAREREIRASLSAADAERQQWLETQRQALRSLSPDAPLREWLPWLNVAIDELRDPALAAVRARPTLEQDVAEMLRGPEAPEALRFMWLWMPDPHASLAAPARAAIASLPAWAEGVMAAAAATPDDRGAEPATKREQFPPVQPVDLSDMAQAAIVIADKYRGSGEDFVTPVRALADALDRHKLPEERLGEDVTYQPRAYLDTWLRAAPRD